MSGLLERVRELGECPPWNDYDDSSALVAHWWRSACLVMAVLYDDFGDDTHTYSLEGCDVCDARRELRAAVQRASK